MLILNYIGLAIGLVVAVWLFRLAFRLLTLDKPEAKKSAARAPSFWAAVLGRSRTMDDWVPDGRVKAGMVYNRRKKRLEMSARLSDDSLDRVFRR